MKYILRLSGEHPTLPRAELEAVLEGEGFEYSISECGRTLLVDANTADNSFLQRLAYTLKAAEYLAGAENVSGLSGPVYDELSDISSFRVTSSPNIQRKMGSVLKGFGLKVDLNNPEVDVMVLELDGRLYAGANIPLQRDYESRKPQNRPYFHPTSMHPKLARALVNLTRVRAGDRLLDPFCGTGGVLIEAGLMGLEVVGWDVDERMVEGCRRNLDAYGVGGNVTVSDALESSAKADAVATDPPYGRASYTTEGVGGLYTKFTSNARGMLDEGSRMALMLPRENDVDTEGFSVADTFDVRIHRSLTRRIWVLEAI